MSTQSLTTDEIKLIADNDDFHIAPYREDGKTPGTLTWIWCVRVNDQLFVRAYNGTSSRWFGSAMKQKAGKIRAAGIEKLVRFEGITDETLNANIDEAYRTKYSSSPYMTSMISDQARAATVRVY